MLIFRFTQQLSSDFRNKIIQNIKNKGTLIIKSFRFSEFKPLCSMTEKNYVNLQKKLFALIHDKINHQPLAKELQKTLNLSHSATYQRIRGEKIINLEEFMLLIDTYKIPFAEVETLTDKKNISQPNLGSA